MSTQNDRDRNRRSNTAGQQQQQRSANRGPYGDLRAQLEITVNGDTKTRFVPIGVVWETDSGNLKIVIESYPNEWSDPHVRRVAIIVKRGAKEAAK